MSQVYRVKILERIRPGFLRAEITSTTAEEQWRLGNILEVEDADLWDGDPQYADGWVGQGTGGAILISVVAPPENKP